MSIYHSVKCSKKELKIFKEKVIFWLKKNKLPYFKIIALTAYDGEIRIHTGGEYTHITKKRILQKDERGYFLSKKEIVKKEYWSVYRVDWNTHEQELLKNYLLSTNMPSHL